MAKGKKGKSADDAPEIDPEAAAALEADYAPRLKI